MRRSCMFIAIAFAIVWPRTFARAEPRSPEKLLLEAQQDYVDGNYQSAIDKARKCIAFNAVRAYRIIGASSCYLKDRAVASDAYSHLDNSNRQFLRYVCSRNQIDLP